MNLFKKSCLGVIALSGMIGASYSQMAPAPMLLDPTTQPKFKNALVIPNVLPGKAKDVLSLPVTQFKQDLGLVKPGTKLPMSTTVWGYNQSYPGPTIQATKGTPVQVYYNNELMGPGKIPLPHPLEIDVSMHWALSGVANWEKLGVPIVTHLHGGHTESASDGLPDAWYTPKFAVKGVDFIKGSTKPYLYSNDQEAATIWYHDHTMGITRLNSYMGLAGFYLITDDNERAKQNARILPLPAYDIPLMIQDKVFTSTGQLYFPMGSPEFFGDHILVNGKIWPFLNVEPREYRFRVLNGSDSRFYNLTLSNGAGFVQIGSDDGLLEKPVAKTSMLIAPGERKDIIIDFSKMNGQTITVKNDAVGPYPDGDVLADPLTTGQIMQFRVNLALNKKTPISIVGNSSLRAPIVPLQTNLPARKVLLHETEDELGNVMPMLGTVEGGAMMWGDMVTENPGLNDTEIWEIYNNTADAHPIHLHLVKMQLIDREEFTADSDPSTGALSNINFSGIKNLPPDDEKGWKDTWVTYPGQVTRVIAKFDVAGKYVWHCHILSHEDHEMMRPLVIGGTSMTGARVPDMNGMSLEKSMDVKTIPNPFINKFSFNFNLLNDSKVRINVYNAKGQIVKKIFDGELKQGPQQFYIGENNWSNGMYFIELGVGSETIIRKMSMQK